MADTETRKTFLDLPTAIEAEEGVLSTCNATLKIRQQPFGTRVAEQFSPPCADSNLMYLTIKSN